MSETHFCGALILAITFLLIIRYSLRKKNSFLNIREIVCDYWKMLSSLRHRVIFMATPISFGIGLTLISPISTSVLETVCTAISILLGLLFATLGAIASGNEKKKKGYPAYGTVFNETINTILYLSCLSITDLVVLFMGLALVPLYGSFAAKLYCYTTFYRQRYSILFNIFDFFELLDCNQANSAITYNIV